MLKIKEKDIQRQITDYLTLKGYFWWRNNSGAFITERAGKKGFYKFGQTGSPDLFVVKLRVDCGQIYGIEVKAEKGKQSEAQLEWATEFQLNGGIYLLVHSVEEIKNL